MENLLSKDQMYQALLEKDSQFEGLFFAAIKTTGIFCRPTCTARKPKKENVEYFITQREALTNGYRPCKVCKPLQKVGTIPADIKKILEEIESNPFEKITDYGIRQRGLNPSQVRRWFKKNHEMTFHTYQRLLRINNAFSNIKNGDKVIEAAFDNGFNSLSGFQYSFKKATGLNPKESKTSSQLVLTRIPTPLGPMFAVANDEGICLLEFTDRRMLETEFKKLQNHYKCSILPGNHHHFKILKTQLQEYFEGKRKKFSVPLAGIGTEFQHVAWEALHKIQYGQTVSYADQAKSIGKSSAIRAIATANGLNQIAIIIPCHRVIGADGELKGYGGGLWRKQWLIDHEKKHASNLISQ
ncbi:MAG: bifunctional transcriptional activator/DNA repair protein Ada [Saprospiraceae bacterium]|nr:bifunctional transcriptional activator/DNA repair protein Ada [Saprospiraceae bacterium]